MKDDNIVSLVKNEEEEQAPKSLNAVLEGMKEHAGELEEGIIIGLTEDGLLLGTNVSGIGNVNMLLDVAKYQLLTDM